jgi:hypothetical protein
MKMKNFLCAAGVAADGRYHYAKCRSWIGVSTSEGCFAGLSQLFARQRRNHGG